MMSVLEKRPKLENWIGLIDHRWLIFFLNDTWQEHIPLVQTDRTPLEALVHQYPPDQQRLKFQWKCKDHRKELRSESVVKSVLTGCPLGPGSPCFPGNPIPPIAPLLPDAPIGPGRPFSPWRTKHIQLIFTVYPLIKRHCWSRDKQEALTNPFFQRSLFLYTTTVPISMLGMFHKFEKSHFTVLWHNKLLYMSLSLGCK